MCETRASCDFLFANRTSSPSFLTLSWQLPSNTSTFPSTSMLPLPILYSTLSLCPRRHATSPSHFPLCCAHICGPPDFEPLDDRWMEWSPIHPSAQGSSSAWVLQWVCHSCGSSTSMQDISALPAVSCPQCSSSAAMPTGRVVRFCVSCQFVVPHDGVSPPPQPPVPPAPAPPPNNDLQADWFSHGPLSRFPSLYGWGHGNHTPPSSGRRSASTQSWPATRDVHASWRSRPKWRGGSLLRQPSFCAVLFPRTSAACPTLSRGSLLLRGRADGAPCWGVWLRTLSRYPSLAGCPQAQMVMFPCWVMC